MNSLTLACNSSLPSKLYSPNHTKLTKAKTKTRISARLDNSQQQQEVNLSVLRFTLGIPGLDESYLPRWIGYGFGSLLLLNHFLGSQTTTAQLRSEALGLSLAAFSVAVPYVGKFLKGAAYVEKANVPEDTEQIFLMSENVSDTEKENLAWSTYVLLRNTNATAVLISAHGKLCVRGYWNTPDNVTKAQTLDWFERQIEMLGLSDLKDALYFPLGANSGLQELLPKGTRSLLVQPVLFTSSSQLENIGFVMLVSSIEYAYNDKDRAWIQAIANKFRGKG